MFELLKGKLETGYILYHDKIILPLRKSTYNKLRHRKCLLAMLKIQMLAMTTIKRRLTFALTERMENAYQAAK